MESAIIIGAIIIAVTIWWVFSPHETIDYGSGPSDNDRKYDIEKGLREGLNPQEVYEKNKYSFKSENDVKKYIEKFGLTDEFNKTALLKSKNPNFLLERRIKMGLSDRKRLKEEIKQYEEDFNLAKETNNYDEAITLRDLIKSMKRQLAYDNQELLIMENELKKKKRI